jgi:hypothetical protein
VLEGRGRAAEIRDAGLLDVASSSGQSSAARSRKLFLPSFGTVGSEGPSPIDSAGVGAGGDGGFTVGAGGRVGAAWGSIVGSEGAASSGQRCKSSSCVATMSSPGGGVQNNDSSCWGEREEYGGGGVQSKDPLSGAGSGRGVDSS